MTDRPLRSSDRGLVVVQAETAQRFGAEPSPPRAGEKLGIARNAQGVLREWPVNGLRHPPIGDTSGWFVWGGREYSEDADLFVPLHIEHLSELCPEILPYLALPPGWRFLIAPGHEDVWFDPALLDP